MVNKVLGTNYTSYMKCILNLQKFGKIGIVWFVNMDESEHGQRGYKWVNKLSSDGTTIYEACVEADEKPSLYLQMRIWKPIACVFNSILREAVTGINVNSSSFLNWLKVLTTIRSGNTKTKRHIFNIKRRRNLYVVLG